MLTLSIVNPEGTSFTTRFRTLGRAMKWYRFFSSLNYKCSFLTQPRVR